MRVIIKPAGLIVIAIAFLVLVAVVAIDKLHLGPKADAGSAPAAVASATPAAAAETLVLPTAETAPAVWRYTTTEPPKTWAQATFNDTAWSQGKAGFGHDQTGHINTPWTSSDIWLRRKVTLPSSLPGVLAFRAFYDEDAEIYVDGVKAADAPGYSSTYSSIPVNPSGTAALKPGAAVVIAVHCRNAVGGQFIDVGL